jgi:hypothetical protein
VSSPAFEYDIFMSYGWSGNALDEGDRAWVAGLKSRLRVALRSSLGRDPAIRPFDFTWPVPGRGEDRRPARWEQPDPQSQAEFDRVVADIFAGSTVATHHEEQVRSAY